MARSKPLEGGSSAEKKSPPQRRCGQNDCWGQALEGTETLSQSHTIHVACIFYLHGGMRWVDFYGNFHVGKYTYNPHMDGAWECMAPVAWKLVGSERQKSDPFGPQDRNITSIPPTAGRQFTCHVSLPKRFQEISPMAKPHNSNSWKSISGWTPFWLVHVIFLFFRDGGRFVGRWNRGSLSSSPVWQKLVIPPPVENGDL